MSRRVLMMNKLIRVIQFGLVLVIIAAIYLIFQHRLDNEAEEKQYEVLQTDYKKKGVRPQFEALAEVNSDIHGWIRLEGTSLNYPVLQSRDNEDYLEYNFKKQKTKKGSIFVDYRNNLQDLSQNTVLYGHSVGDQTMFDDLHQYLDQTFYDAHQTIEFDTKYHQYALKVFSAYSTDAHDNYIQTNFNNVHEYEQFLKETKNKSKIKTDISVHPQDKIMTLSTCEDAFSRSDKRVVVVGKLIENR